MKRNTRKNRQTLTQFVLKTVNGLEAPTTAAHILRTVLDAFPNTDQNSVRAILTMSAKSGKISKEVIPNQNTPHVLRVLYGPLRHESTQKPHAKEPSEQMPVIGWDGKYALEALSALYPEKTKTQIVDAALIRLHLDAINGKIAWNANTKQGEAEPSHDVSVANEQGEIHIHVHLHGIN